MESNVNASSIGSATQSNDFLMLNVNNFTFQPMLQTFTFSGTTAPTSATYLIWYDTANNLVKYSSDTGTTWQTGFSLPFALFSRISGVPKSIDSLFNGFGYISSTIWVDKGVKCLIPNGRNEDGSLNNIEYTVSSIRTRTYTSANNNTSIGITRANILIPLVKAGIDVKYNEQENLIKVTSTGLNWGACYTGLVSLDNTGRVTSFKVPQPFSALDYNDKPQIASWSFPSSKLVALTVGASGTAYTAPANGIVTSFMTATANDGYVGLRWGDAVVNLISCMKNAASAAVLLPVQKGQSFSLIYGNGTPLLNFYYAQGEV